MESYSESFFDSESQGDLDEETQAISRQILDCFLTIGKVYELEEEHAAAELAEIVAKWNVEELGDFEGEESLPGVKDALGEEYSRYSCLVEAIRLVEKKKEIK